MLWLDYTDYTAITIIKMICKNCQGVFEANNPRNTDRVFTLSYNIITAHPYLNLTISMDI